MKHILKSDKRGISVIIGYIILIAITISLSVLVYNWLVFTIPSEETKCPEAINLDIKEISCSSTLRQLNFTIKNNGLFSIDGYIIKVNNEKDARIGIHDIGEYRQKISPQQEYKVKIDYDHTNYPNLQKDLTLLEILPFLVNEDNTKTLCQPSAITQIKC